MQEVCKKKKRKNKSQKKQNKALERYKSTQWVLYAVNVCKNKHLPSK